MKNKNFTIGVTKKHKYIFLNKRAVKKNQDKFFNPEFTEILNFEKLF